MIDGLEKLNLDAKSKSRLRKILDAFLVGELYGLHTLHSILDALQITSRNLYKLWDAYTHRQIKELTTQLCIASFKEALGELAKKSESSWSRAEVTVVIDDSIFKQWLKNMPRGAEYAKFFSGQVHKSVYGFRVSLVGVAIGKNFYPLYFEIVPKGKCTKKTALDLLKKVHQLFIQVAEKERVSYPNLFLSVDSGFTDEDLIAYCKEHHIGFIGVPKRNNVFKIGRYKMNLKKYIEKIFEKKEKVHQQKYEAQAKTPPPFLMRKKVYFQALNREVILVFFRLNGSGKVTVIFSLNFNTTAKTLRRRFFQRTKIELFFRFLKDTLKIQTSPSRNLESFEKKLSLFILKALVCKAFEKFCHQHYTRLRKYPFTRLRRHIIYQGVDKSPLESLFKKGAFAN